MNDICLGCFFEGLSFLHSTCPGKNILRVDNLLKNFQCFLIFGFWLQTIENLQWKICKFSKTAIYASNRKKMRKKWKIVHYSTIFRLSARNCWDIRRKNFCSIVQTAFFLSEETFKGKKIPEELILFQTIFWIREQNVQTINDKVSISLSILHSTCLGRFWGEESFLEKFIRQHFWYLGWKQLEFHRRKLCSDVKTAFFVTGGKDEKIEALSFFFSFFSLNLGH